MLHENASASHQFPRTPDQISDVWLTQVLRASNAIRRSSVVGHRTAPLGQQGMVSDVVRVTLDYDVPEEGAPRTLVAKLASSDAATRQFASGAALYRREVAFYADIARDAGISVPRCYHAELDRESAEFVLLLEDLGDGKMGGSMAHSIEEVGVALDALAAFHAHWWQSERLTEFRWLPPPDHPLAIAAMSVGVSAQLPSLRERHPTSFGGVLGATVEWLGEHYGAFATLLTDRPSTLLHGDFHTQQLVFPCERGGRFAVYDWQNVSKGCGGQDVARIVVTCLPVDWRRAEDGDLLRRYHAGLSASGVTGYSLEDCWRDYRLGIANSAALNTAFPADADDSGGAVESVYARLDAALADHDVLALLTGDVG